jgi:hypothetical protein
MRPWILSAALAASLVVATPALAAPVFVSPRMETGPVPADTPIVAFSYDVRAIYPAIANRFERWRPKPPSGGPANPKVLPLLPMPFGDYMLMHSTQIEEYRDTFMKGHKDEPELVKLLMPKFDAIFEKHGAVAPPSGGDGLLSVENPRQLWCRKVAQEINEVLQAYNANYGGDTSQSTYRIQYARWLGQRNEAVRQAAAAAGANPGIAYMEGTTNLNGMALFDLPPGLWYIACQSEDKSWYKLVRVTEKGGNVPLTPGEASLMRLDLASWTGE